jgi:hypothetical protein
LFNASESRFAAEPVEQVREFDLERILDAKTGDSNYRRFVARYGTSIHELDALEPAQLQAVLTRAIDSLIDVPALTPSSIAKRKIAYG